VATDGPADSSRDSARDVSARGPADGPTIRRAPAPDDVTLEPNALAVLERRYLRRDADGRVVETPGELFHRVAADVAAAEAAFVRPATGADAGGVAAGSEADEVVAHWTRRFEEMLRARRFLPNTPTLLNAGLAHRQLAACFVLPVEDSIEEIFETLKHAALVHKTGGGTGFSFSRIRPQGDRVDGRGALASGPVSFMAVFDAATEHVKQGGARRGANMAVLRYDHPDIVDFVACKAADVDAMTNFNISVGVDAAFWDAVDHDGDVILVNPRTGAAAGTVAARALFDRIVDAAWRSGDPGLVFLDRMNRRQTNPTPSLGRIEATNPCGEQPLLPYEACNLGSLALQRYVTTTPDGPAVDRDVLRVDVHAAVRFLDDVIERCDYPLAEITAMTRDGNRKIGLGVMGWADLLVRLGIPYDDDRAVRLAEELMAFISAEADTASERLAAERGSFANWGRSVYAAEGRPMRNATRTTIAPTGSISIIAGCSSGIEPLFALSMRRSVLDGTTLTETHPALHDALRNAGCATAEVLDVVARTGSVRAAPGVPGDVAAVFATAHEIDPAAHVRMQAAFQRHTDNAVSKTVNLRADASRDDVADVLRAAWRHGCLGVTVFRDGCRPAQVLSAGATAPARVTTSPRDDGRDRCPDCGHPGFEFAEGCGKCQSCGFTTC
jgi:ribonucleoside-diphosphate reductase alpha chain